MQFYKFNSVAIVLVAALGLGACSSDDDNKTPAPAATISVPDLSGLSQTEAEASITAANLSVGTITTSDSATVAVDDVISQDPSSGTMVTANSSVNLVISTGVAPTTATFSIAVTNITNAQPMTPIAVVLHKHGYDAWNLGAAASAGLEVLAESGSPADFLSEADADTTNVVMSAASAGLTMPGITATIMMEVPVADVAGLHVSFASMFANTNDAFTGLKLLHIADLAVDESVSNMARVYDAGTEANSEAAADLPGMSGTGGTNTQGVVVVHRGVVTTADGLTTSALGEADRWLGPGAKVTVTRVQ